MDSHYLDNIDNNAVIINVHLCSHSEQSRSKSWSLSTHMLGEYQM
jgi:hypothetical protein